MQTNATPPMGKASSENQQEQLERAKEHGAKVIARTIATVIAIVVGIVFVLFIVSRAALYDSIPAMLSDMGSSLVEAIARIFS